MAAKKEETKSAEPDKKQETSEKEETRDEQPDKVAELEKKFGELSSTIEAQNEFIQGASVVINTLAYDPELRAAFQNKLRGGVVAENGGANEQPKQGEEKKTTSNNEPGKDDPVTKQVNEVAASQRQDIISDFENSVGIGNLNKEEQKEARRAIESELNSWGWSIASLPLPQLRDRLNKAYVGANLDKFREEGKLEGIATMRNNQMGTMPTISGGSPTVKGAEETLNERQRAMAEKLGVDVEKAEKRYLTRDEEQKRPHPSELKK